MLKLSVKMSGGVTDDVIFSVNILVKHAELNFSVYVQRKLEKVEKCGNNPSTHTTCEWLTLCAEENHVLILC